MYTVASARNRAWPGDLSLLVGWGSPRAALTDVPGLRILPCRVHPPGTEASGVVGVSDCPFSFSQGSTCKSVAASLSLPLNCCAGVVLHMMGARKGHVHALVLRDWV